MRLLSDSASATRSRVQIRHNVQACHIRSGDRGPDSLRCSLVRRLLEPVTELPPSMMRSLPVQAAPGVDRPVRRRASGPHRSRDSGTLVRPRVLIVEDHEDTSEMYAWCMRAAGWIVEVAHDGQEALTAASDFGPDVIVMDLRLPVLDGLDATRMLKSDPDTRLIPIVGCSGVDGPEAETLAREAGCDRFVAKPCPPEDLRTLLENIVRTEAPP